MTVVLFSLLLLGVAVHRLVELVISRRRLRGRPEALVRERWTFPLMAGLHTALVTAPVAEVLLLGRPFVPALTAAAGLVLLVATALRIWTLRTLGRSWNVRVVMPERVITTGPYAWVRHPNYAIVVLEVAALPLLHSAWLSALVLSLWNALVLARRIRAEEAALSTLPAWRAAMTGKPRLIPGLL